MAHRVRAAGLPDKSSGQNDAAPGEMMTPGATCRPTPWSRCLTPRLTGLWGRPPGATSEQRTRTAGKYPAKATVAEACPLARASAGEVREGHHAGPRPRARTGVPPWVLARHWVSMANPEIAAHIRPEAKVPCTPFVRCGGEATSERYDPSEVAASLCSGAGSPAAGLGCSGKCRPRYSCVMPSISRYPHTGSFQRLPSSAPRRGQANPSRPREAGAREAPSRFDVCAAIFKDPHRRLPPWSVGGLTPVEQPDG